MSFQFSAHFTYPTFPNSDLDMTRKTCMKREYILPFQSSPSFFRALSPLCAQTGSANEEKEAKVAQLTGKVVACLDSPCPG